MLSDMLENSIVLHGSGGKTAADQTLGVVHGVGRVERGLVLGGVADEALGVVKCDVGRRDAVSLVVCDDLDLSILVDANARVGCA